VIKTKICVVIWYKIWYNKVCLPCGVLMKTLDFGLEGGVISPSAKTTDERRCSKTGSNPVRAGI